MNIELQDIFQRYGMEFRNNHRLPLHQLKTMNCIESCRTSKLGGHIDECDSCGHLRISYNSCRNRHCPKCQYLSKERWLLNREQDLLPVGYFHVVFTIPDGLNPIALRNQKEVYSILFRAASETLLELGKDPKYLGGQLGFISVLHTWGQNLMDHPHLHCIVPGGGLSLDGSFWMNSRKKFFIPVKVLSKKFQGKFLAYLKEAYGNGRLRFPGQIESLGRNCNFQRLIDNLYQINWVVYCKPPFKSPYHVLRYLGRYTHRVAISNNRIIDISNGQVAFKWRDYKDHNRNKLMSVETNEFIRRYLLHVLPPKFVKIRHYGILSNRNRNSKLKVCQKLTGTIYRVKSEKLSIEELLLKLTGFDLRSCPCCNKGKMVRKLKLDPKICSPPI